jgi:hypothetical protein
VTQTIRRPIRKSPEIIEIISVLSSKGWKYPKAPINIIRIEIHEIINWLKSGGENTRIVLLVWNRLFTNKWG